MYFDLDTGEICSRDYLHRKHPGLVIKGRNQPLSVHDLELLNATELREPSIVDDVATGNAVLVDGVYEREYRSYTSAELTDQAVQQREARYGSESDKHFMEALRKRADGDTAGADAAEVLGLAVVAQIKTDISIP